MQDRIYITNLYDIYGELLTQKQKEYFEDYYFDNLSLSEISENYNVSRNAVHKQIKDTEDKLKHFEDILKIYEKNKKIEKICDKLDKEIKNKILNIL